PLLDQIIPDGFGTLFGKLLVVFVAAHAVGMAFDGKMQTWISQHNAGNLGQTLARAGQQFIAAGLEQNIRQIGDDPASSIASRENGVELFEQPRAQFLLFFFRLLPQLLGLRRRPLSLGGFLGQSLLLGQRFRLGFFCLFLLASCFLRCLLGFRLGFFGRGARLFGLFLRLLGASPPLAFGFGIGPSSCLAGFGFRLFRRRFSLSFVFGALLYRHHAGFFCGLRSFACGRLDRGFPLLLPVCGLA